MTVQALIDASEGKSTIVYHSGYNDNGEKEDFMLFKMLNVYVLIVKSNVML